MLYEMTTGALSFPGGSSAEIFKAILDASPVPALRLNPAVPPELERILNKALEKDRNLRYQSAAEMRADLQRLKRDTDSGPIPCCPFHAARQSGGCRYGSAGAGRLTVGNARPENVVGCSRGERNLCGSGAGLCSIPPGSATCRLRIYPNYP